MVKSFKMRCNSPNFDNISPKLIMDVVGISVWLSEFVNGTHQKGAISSAARGGAEP